MQAGPSNVTVLQVLPSLVTGGVERGTIEINQAIVGAGWTGLVASAGGGPGPAGAGGRGGDHPGDGGGGVARRGGRPGGALGPCGAPRRGPPHRSAADQPGPF